MPVPGAFNNQPWKRKTRIDLLLSKRILRSKTVKKAIIALGGAIDDMGGIGTRGVLL